MVRLKVFNVGHGEAMILTLDNGRKVIRDFGRSFQAKKTATSISVIAIIQKYQNHISPIKTKIDIVLSHAHDDHFNGFIKLHDLGFKKIFKTAYIPYIDLTTIESLGGKILKLSSYLYTYYGIKTNIGKNAKNWILAIPILADLSEMICGVCTGYIIKSWVPNGEILWPPIPGSATSYYSDFETNIDNQISFFETNLEDTVMLDYKRQVLDEILKLLAQQIYINPDEPIVTGGDSTVNRINDILENSLRFSRYFRTNANPFKNILRYKNSIDDNSIVFRLFDTKQNHALFLSDLNSKYIREITLFHMNGSMHFRIIKSSHHGSRYNDMMHVLKNTSDTIIHCCGPSNQRIKQPDVAYRNVSGNIICTDWNTYSTSKWTRPCPYLLFAKQSKTFIL